MPLAPFLRILRISIRWHASAAAQGALLIMALLAGASISAGAENGSE